MKRILLSLLTIITPLVTFAQEQSTSEAIDETFRSYTGWFVEAIFYEIPFTETFQIPF